jgi:hypothetical protein
MSICTVDQATYDNIYYSTIVRFINSGMDLPAARNLAKELMDNAFRTDDTSRDDARDARDAANGLAD